MRSRLHSYVTVLSLRRQRQLGCTAKSIILILSACSLSLVMLCFLHPAYNKSWQSDSKKVLQPDYMSDPESLFRSKVRSNWSCPLQFERTSFEEVTERFYTPYILGGSQRPECSNCHKDNTWAHFCRYESHGPVCTAWDRWRIIDTFVGRARRGAPGVAEMLTMTPCDLFQYLESRTLWLVGDSLTQETMKAAICFFSEFWEFEVEQKPADLADNPRARAAMLKQPTGWCVVMQRGSRICHLRGNYGVHMTEDIFPYLSDLGAEKSDIVVFNFGIWHNDLDTFAGNVSEVFSYLRTHKADMPFLIWREVAPQHFDTPLGEFSCGGCPAPDYPYECKEVKGIELDEADNLHCADPEKRILLEGGWRNRIVRPIMEHLGIPILNIWNQSLPIWDYHHNYQNNADCTHMCHPSAYQVWVAQLYLLLRDLDTQLPEVPHGERT